MASAAIWAYWARCLNGTGKASPTTPNISLSSSIAPASCQLALALPHAIRPQANQVIRHPRPRPENLKKLAVQVIDDQHGPDESLHRHATICVQHGCPTCRQAVYCMQRPAYHVRQSAPCLVVALPVALSARLSLLSLGRYLHACRQINTSYSAFRADCVQIVRSQKEICSALTELVFRQSITNES